MAYDGLFQKSGAHAVGYPRLEADDCVALTVERIKESVADAKIWIITSDMDYLQLSDEMSICIISTPRYYTKQKCHWNPECDKFCKIVCGDKVMTFQVYLPNVVLKLL